MIRIKICGVTSAADVRAVAESGADAIGFNFWSKSKRRVEPAVAAELARELPAFVTRVGVFVDEDRARIEEIAAEVGLDAPAEMPAMDVPRDVASEPPPTADAPADMPAGDVYIFVDGFESQNTLAWSLTFP